MKNFLKSFRFAINGILLAFEQRNMRVHLFITIFVLLLGLYFELNSTEWLLILVMIGNIFTAEIFNTSIEDLSEKEKQLGLPYEDAGSARDLAAGAVLIQAIISVGIGVAIFLPKIVEKFF